ncbi:hypothetical protein VTO42DRAFT_1445 [Malbranchea cinnamomea]
MSSLVRYRAVPRALSDVGGARCSLDTKGGFTLRFRTRVQPALSVLCTFPASSRSRRILSFAAGSTSHKPWVRCRSIDGLLVTTVSAKPGPALPCPAGRSHKTRESGIRAAQTQTGRESTPGVDARRLAGDQAWEAKPDPWNDGTSSRVRSKSTRTGNRLVSRTRRRGCGSSHSGELAEAAG